MGIFNTIFGQKEPLTAANQAIKICHRLFHDTTIKASDLDDLLALGDQAIHVFHSELYHHTDGTDHINHISRQEQLLDIIGNYTHASSEPSLDIGSDIDSTVIALLACFLDTEQTMLGVKAVNYLAEFGADAYQPLCTALQSNNAHSRNAAARALGACKHHTQPHHDHIIAVLIKSLHDDDARVRSNAAESLGKLADTRAIEALMHQLSDSNWLVRESVTAALACFNHEYIINQLSQLMQHDTYHIRIQALRSMHRLHIASLEHTAKHATSIDTPQTLAMLISALDDVHPEVQWAAVDALASFRASILPLLSHYPCANSTLRQHIANACETIGMDRIAIQLSNNDHRIRIAVTDILAQQQCIELLPLLANTWQHEKNSATQTHMITALAQLIHPAGKNAPDIAISCLIQATDSSDKNIAYQAKKALASSSHPMAEAFMQPALQTSQVAIGCPSCLKILYLNPPLTHKPWTCPQCHLDFSIHNGADDVLIVSPTTSKLQAAPLAAHGILWHDILKLDADADANSIKRAFRKLLKQYHPDKVATLGPEFKQLAEEKTRTLTWALRLGLKKRN